MSAEPAGYETVHSTQVVYPQHLNHHGTLFGGEALQLMDTAAFVAASRLTRATMVTVAVQEVVFESPVRRGDIVETEARVIKVGRSSVTVEVENYAEVPETGDRRRSGHGRFVMVAVDAGGNSVPINPPAQTAGAPTA